MIRASGAWFAWLLVVGVSAGAYGQSRSPETGAADGESTAERRAAEREEYRADLFELRGELASFWWVERCDQLSPGAAEIEQAIEQRLHELDAEPRFRPRAEQRTWIERTRASVHDAAAQCAPPGASAALAAPPEPEPEFLEPPPPPPPPDPTPPEPPVKANAPGPVEDVFRSRLFDLKEARGGYGRYAYLVTKTAPRPDDDGDPVSQAIRALFVHAAGVPGDLGDGDLDRYGVVYVPAQPETRGDGGDWRAWADGYSLRLSNRIRSLACAKHCKGRGPFIVVTGGPIADRPIVSAAIFDLSRATPSMVGEFVRRLKALLMAGHDWSGSDAPGTTLLHVRNELARVGSVFDAGMQLVVDVAGRVGRLRAVPASFGAAATGGQ